MYYSSAPPRAGGVVGLGPRRLQAAPSPATGHACAPSSSPIPWVSPAPSLPVPGHWQLLWGSSSPGLSPIPRTSATPTHLRRLSSFRCDIYLNVSFILHPLPRGGIKFTEKQEKQSRAKLVITIKPRENQSRDTQFEICPFHFLKLPFFSSFYCYSSLLPASTTSFHQGPLGFSLPASSALFIDIFNNSEKSYFKCTGQNSPPGLKNKSCHVWQTAARRRQTSNIYIQICKFKESIDMAYSFFSFFIRK